MHEPPVASDEPACMGVLINKIEGLILSLTQRIGSGRRRVAILDAMCSVNLL